MFQKIIKEIVYGKVFFGLFVTLYTVVIWWAVLSHKPIAVRATWTLTFLLGIVIVIVGVVTSIDAWQSPLWSQTKAKLIKCYVKKMHDSEGSTYAPVVIYRFKISDRQYIGSDYDFSDISGSRITANEKIESLKELVDSEGYINIYYKPSEPELNVIFPGVHLIHAIRLIFGSILIVISLLTLLEIIQW